MESQESELVPEIKMETEDPDEWKPVGLCGQPRQGSHDQGRCTCDGAEGKVHMQDSPAKRTRKRKAEPVVLRRKYHRKPKADKKEKSKPLVIGMTRMTAMTLFRNKLGWKEGETRNGFLMRSHQEYAKLTAAEKAELKASALKNRHVLQTAEEKRAYAKRLAKKIEEARDYVETLGGRLYFQLHLNSDHYRVVSKDLDPIDDQCQFTHRLGVFFQHCQLQATPEPHLALKKPRIRPEDTTGRRRREIQKIVNMAYAKAAGLEYEQGVTRFPYSKMDLLGVEVSGWPDEVPSLRNPKLYNLRHLDSILACKDQIQITLARGRKQADKTTSPKPSATTATKAAVRKQTRKAAAAVTSAPSAVPIATPSPDVATATSSAVTAAVVTSVVMATSTENGVTAAAKSTADTKASVATENAVVIGTATPVTKTTSTDTVLASHSTSTVAKAAPAPVVMETQRSAITSETPASAVTVATPDSATGSTTVTSAVTMASPSSADTVTTEASADTMTTEASADAVTTEASADAVTTEAPADTMITEASADAVTTEACADAVTTEASADTITTEASADAVTTEASVDAVTTQASADSVTTEAPADAVTTQACADAVTTEACADAVTTEASADTMTTEASADAVTTQSPVCIATSTSAVTTASSTSSVSMETQISSASLPVSEASSTATASMITGTPCVSMATPAPAAMAAPGDTLLQASIPLPEGFDVETDESGMMFLSVPDDIADQLLSTLSDADIGEEPTPVLGPANVKDKPGTISSVTKQKGGRKGKAKGHRPRRTLRGWSKEQDDFLLTTLDRTVTTQELEDLIKNNDLLAGRTISSVRSRMWRLRLADSAQ